MGYKLLDKDTFNIPNELLKIIDGVENPNCLDNELLPSLHHRSLSKDGCYFEISYDYIFGDHKPKTLKKFLGVVKILDLLHTHGSTVDHNTPPSPYRSTVDHNTPPPPCRSSGSQHPSQKHSGSQNLDSSWHS